MKTIYLCGVLLFVLGTVAGVNLLGFIIGMANGTHIFFYNSTCALIVIGSILWAIKTLRTLKRLYDQYQ